MQLREVLVLLFCRLAIASLPITLTTALTPRIVARDFLRTWRACLIKIWISSGSFSFEWKLFDRVFFLIINQHSLTSLLTAFLRFVFRKTHRLQTRVSNHLLAQRKWLDIMNFLGIFFSNQRTIVNGIFHASFQQTEEKIYYNCRQDVIFSLGARWWRHWFTLFWLLQWLEHYHWALVTKVWDESFPL